MKNIRYCFCVLLLGMLGQWGVAQSSYRLKTSSFDLIVGPSFPIGSLSQRGYQDVYGNDLKIHGAKVGVSYGLDLKFYIINEYVGINLSLGGNVSKLYGDVWNGLDNKDPLNQLSWKNDITDNWRSFYAMVGLAFRYPFAEILLVSAHLQLGYANLLSPFYRSTAEQGSNVYSHELGSATDHNFGFGAGMDLKFMISRGFHLGLRLDYKGAIPHEFDQVASNVYLEKDGNKKDRTTVIPAKTYNLVENWHIFTTAVVLSLNF